MSADTAASAPSRGPHHAVLTVTVIGPSGERNEVQVTHSPFRIGRLPECEIPLRDNRVSRHHGQILLEGSTYYIEDSKSRHGLFVNGKKVDRHELRLGDEIDFGIEDSYRLVIGKDLTFTAPLMEKVAAMPESEGTGNLGRLSAVLEVARALQASLAVDEVLAAAVDAALVVTGAERGFLMLTDGSGELEVKVARNLGGEQLAADELRVPRRVIQKALTRRRDLLFMTFDPAKGETADAELEETVARLELRSAICVPLVRIRIGQQHETSLLSPGEDTLGALYMDSKQVTGDLSAANRELLQTLAVEISTVLENARLLAQEHKQQSLEQELKIARDIQQTMLPAQLPAEGWLVAEGSSEACFQVGGDYFDVMELSADQWGVVQADVSGKGVSAALLTSLIQGAFFATASLDPRPSEIVARVNRYICERSRLARFATVFYCLVGRDGAVRWVSAGHCPAILVRASGETEWLNATSFPIGLFPEAVFPQQEITLSEGDKVVVYTDGVSEAVNWSNERFGEERLREAARRHASSSAPRLFQSIREEISSFTSGAPQNDDLTLLVLGYQG